MNANLLHETLKLEGDMFKLGRKIDKASNMDEYVKLQKELYLTKVKHGQYQEIINEFSKMEQLKKIKRKMLR